MHEKVRCQKNYDYYNFFVVIKPSSSLACLPLTMLIFNVKRQFLFLFYLPTLKKKSRTDNDGLFVFCALLLIGSLVSFFIARR